MKKLSIIQTLSLVTMFFIGLVGTALAQIKVISPNGGEQLPRNGYMIFWWHNDVPLNVTTYLDYYGESVAEQPVSVSIISQKGYYYIGDDYSQNSGSMFTSSNLPIGFYKLRVIGVTESGQVYEDSSDSVFRISGDAAIGITALGAADWKVGETKKFQVSWTGFRPGDKYSVQLLPTHDHLGEAYGFILNSGIVETENGQVILDCAFPTTAMSAFPEYQISIPIDAEYTALVMHEPSFLRADASPVSLIISEVRVSVIDKEDVTVTQFRTATVLTLTVDARYAKHDVQTLQVPVIVGSAQPLVCACTFYAGTRQISAPQVMSPTGSKPYDYATFEIRGLTVPKGTVKTIELRCTPIDGVGLCEFGLDREGELLVSGRRWDRISSSMRGRWGSLVNVIPTVLPRPCGKPGHRELHQRPGRR